MLLDHALAIDWERTEQQATAIAVVVAVIAVLVSMFSARRQERLTREGQRQQEEHARAAASRSEAAAALTDDYTRRIVDALESMARNGGAGNPVKKVRWSLVHFDGDRYILTNQGELSAIDVDVSSHKSMELLDVRRQDVEPDASMTFLASPSLATSDYTITVTWAEPDSSERKVWKYPLPPDDKGRKR